MSRGYDQAHAVGAVRGLHARGALVVPALHQQFWVSVIAEILIWSLFAASVNLLFGYVGLLSFGQALYFGFGMYGVAIGIDGTRPVVLAGIRRSASSRRWRWRW